MDTIYKSGRNIVYFCKYQIIKFQFIWCIRIYEGFFLTFFKNQNISFFSAGIRQEDDKIFPPADWNMKYLQGQYFRKENGYEKGRDEKKTGAKVAGLLSWSFSFKIVLFLISRRI